jgi:SpoVK/Ycf46/Vps4 family AAA+-type ATPase
MGSIITKLDELIADGKLFREARRSQPAVNFFDALDDGTDTGEDQESGGVVAATINRKQKENKQ